MTSPKTETHYEISVWNHEGDVLKKLWDASEADLDEVRKQYADDPVDVVIDRDWEETVHEDDEWFDYDRMAMDAMFPE